MLIRLAPTGLTKPLVREAYDFALLAGRERMVKRKVARYAVPDPDGVVGVDLEAIQLNFVARESAATHRHSDFSATCIFHDSSSSVGANRMSMDRIFGDVV